MNIYVTLGVKILCGPRIVQWNFFQVGSCALYHGPISCGALCYILQGAMLTLYNQPGLSLPTW